MIIIVKLNIRHPSTSTLSPVLDEMMQLHGRLQPHLLRYRQLMSDDQDYSNRVCILCISLHHCRPSKMLSCFVLYSTKHIVFVL